MKAFVMWRSLAVGLTSLCLAACSNDGFVPPKTPKTAPTHTLSTEKAELKDGDEPDIDLSISSEKAKSDEVAFAYDDSWFVGPNWPGEYPDGFSVKARHVVLNGRITPSVNEAADLPCIMEPSATIHPWNTARIQTDELNFVSATKTAQLTVTQEADIRVEPETGDEKDLNISVSPGQVITLERYFGEGFGQIAIDGISYTADLQQLTDLTNGNENAPLTTHQWVEVTCADKGASRAWLLYSEVIKMPGIIKTPLSSFGIAKDLE